jgi:WD40 repeat protein
MHSRVGRGASNAAPPSASRVDALMRGGHTAVQRRHPEIVHSAAASHHINDAYVEDLKDAFGIPPADADYPPARSAVLLPSGPPSTSIPETPGPVLLSAQWHQGPIDPAGTLLELSDRPVMCMALNTATLQATVGCSDHASYVIDVSKAVKQKTLFGKRVGHSEWVTGLTYLNDASNRVVSCGMDGKVMVWEPITSRTSITMEPKCTVLEGHFGSISTVVAPKGYDTITGECAFGHLVVSTGYDKSVRLWDARSMKGLVECKEHKAPILVQSVQPQHSFSSRLCTATGDRDGVAKVWDLGAGESTGTMSGHKGHITAMCWMPPLAYDAATPLPSSLPTHEQLLATGAQDGHVRVWDMRSKACAANVELHVTDSGAGAVSDIAMAVIRTEGAGFESVLVTTGADKCVCVLDPRMGFTARHRLATHRDFIYSLAIHGSLAFSGDGSGSVIAHDLVAGKPLWGLGANAAAVRCIGVAGNRLVASGDDGKAIIYRFS